MKLIAMLGVIVVMLAFAATAMAQHPKTVGIGSPYFSGSFVRAS